MALSPEQIAAEQQRILAEIGRKSGKGRVQSHTPDRMNALELAYAEHLLARMVDGDVVRFDFESLKLRLGPRCWYTVDFLVQRSDGSLEIHETKGHMRDDAAVKLRITEGLWYPFRLFVVRRKRERWVLEERGA